MQDKHTVHRRANKFLRNMTIIHQQIKKNAKTDKIRRMLVTVQLMIY